MILCVYVLVHQHPVLLHIETARDLAVATMLAKSVQDIFGAPAWLADYWSPADRRTLQWRAARPTFFRPPESHS